MCAALSLRTHRQVPSLVRYINLLPTTLRIACSVRSPSETLGSSREVRMAPSVARESTLHCKLNSQLYGAAVRSILSVGPEIDNGNPGSKGTRRFPAKSGPRVIGYTDNAARRSCTISFLRNVGSSYSEEPGVEILYHGKARLWNEPVLGWLRRPSGI